jgi:hypothetical protein
MKKVLIVLVLFIGFSSSSLASSFGGLQYTASNVFGGDLRARVNFSAGAGAFGVRLQTDLLFNAITLDPDGKFNIYYGGGVTVGYASTSSGNTSVSALLIGGQATGGISYLVTPNVLLFLEGSTGYVFGIASGTSGGSSIALPAFGTVYVVGIGVAYRF